MILIITANYGSTDISGSLFKLSVISPLVFGELLLIVISNRYCLAQYGEELAVDK
jgi:hypothetical protein